MMLPDVPASIFDGEAECAVVIGQRTARVSAGPGDEPRVGYVLHRRPRLAACRLPSKPSAE